VLSGLQLAVCFGLPDFRLGEYWGLIRGFLQNSGNTMQHVVMWALKIKTRLFHKLEDSCIYIYVFCLRLVLFQIFV
jgi:hypothetical protein